MQAAERATRPPDRIRLAAPAKLNLGLRVIDRREDGYHRLASLFLPLELADALEVERRAAAGVEFELAGDEPGVPTGPANLARRAAEAFLGAAGLDAGLHIRLDKRVPAAAGLGGGSSDAATVLRILGRMFPGALPAPDLGRLALQLGADVPFFLDPRPARVTGIGEIVDPLAEAPRLPLLLAHPGTPLETRAVFQAYDATAAPAASLTLDEAGSSLRRLSACLGDAAAGAPIPAALLANDLEAAASGLCPALAALREALAATGALGVGMSGSGPTMYGVFESEAAAQQARRQLPALAARSWVTASQAAP